ATSISALSHLPGFHSMSGGRKSHRSGRSMAVDSDGYKVRSPCAGRKPNPMLCPLLPLLLWALLPGLQNGSDPLLTESFEAPKYGVTTQIPKDWPLAVREKDDRVFVAFIPQVDPNRPGVAACELGLAPSSLEEYRTRIDSNAKRHGRASGKLASNR